MGPIRASLFNFLEVGLVVFLQKADLHIMLDWPGEEVASFRITFLRNNISYWRTSRIDFRLNL